MPSGWNAPSDRFFQKVNDRIRRLRPMPMAAALGALLIASVAAFAVISALGEDAPASGRTPTTSTGSSGLDSAGEGVIDTDLSGVPDSLENFLYGTDPEEWSTSDTPLPDGWITKHGYDPLDPVIDLRPAAKPPVESLPPAYGNSWPVRFTPTLYEIYSYSQPSDWDETESGPFLNGLDPRKWDNSGDGIPDGWLMHHGLDPLDDGIGTRTLSGSGGLTVQEAFQHNTDPTKLDSDGDGLSDQTEIMGPADPSGGEPFPPSDPSTFSTGGTGVCDGYLVAHGLDPSEPANGYRDLARSGATTLQKFQWSFGSFGAATCGQGDGLDPMKTSTSGGPVPDGWLLKYGLDPLDPAVLDEVTQSSTDHADGPWAHRTEAPGSMPQLAHVTLTVLDEYMHGRPTDWNETIQGPWGGGTDPTKIDSDGDGLPDSVEMRGYYIGVSLDVGPGSDEGLKARQHYVASSDPTRLDTSGDGLSDYEGVVSHGTDPTKRDTDLDGIPDSTEVGLDVPLDPTRADSAGGYLLDGERLELLQTRSAQYQQDMTYGFPGEPGVVRKVTDWACALDGVRDHIDDTSGDCLLEPDDVSHLFGPEGDLDLDEVINVLDPDMDGDGLPNGWEVDPSLYGSPYGAGPPVRSVTDPVNLDTDGDDLRDGWEVKFGSPIHDRDRYSLDPAAWDSLCNPQKGDTGCGFLSDGDRDDDDDGIAWVRYVMQNGDIVRDEADDLQFPFPNRLEQQFEDAGADPNKASSDGDGLLDGWKVFWGFMYPFPTVEDRGLYYPSAPDGEFSIPDDAPRPTLGTPQPEVVLADGNVIRFSLEDDKRPQEVANGTFDFAGNTIHRFEESIEFTFQDAQRLGVNPYMVEEGMAGDGIPDWWKWHHRTPIQAGPGCIEQGSFDPLDPGLGAKFDLVGDGLTVRENHDLGTNPWCASTTLTGFQDAIMAGITEDHESGVLARDITQAHRDNVMDFSRAEAILNADIDSDRDGLSDAHEIIGFDHDGRFIQGLDPGNPDTDGDGLLDGEDQCLADGEGDNDTWIALLLDLGISYQRTDCDGVQGQDYLFRGELTAGTHPLNSDDKNQAIPAGWLASHDSLDQAPASWDAARARYSLGMPSWWDESVHGPWWGGLRPTAPDDDLSTLQVDSDRDGLKDRDGGAGFEDPMPGANWDNTWPAIDWSAYPLLDLDLEEPVGVEGLENASLPQVVQRIIAQSYLHPRDIGDGFISYPKRSSEDVPAGRATVCIESDKAGQGFRDAEGGPVSPPVFTKGETIQFVGRVVADCDDDEAVAFANVTVEARINGQTFGAGFSDGEGRFAVPINVSNPQSVFIPEDADARVLRGATSGFVNWSADSSAVEPGAPRTLDVRTYATDTLNAQTRTILVKVEAGSIVSITLPPSVTTGVPFPIDYRLTDSSGVPLQDDVYFQWEGQQDNVSGQPDQNGAGRMMMPAPHELSGPQTLRVHSRPDSDHVTGADISREVTLRNPVEVHLSDLPGPLDAGKTFDVDGHVSFQAKGVVGVPVTINLTLGGENVVGAVVETTSGGQFSTELAIPSSQPRGEHLLVVTAQQTMHTIEREASDTLDVRSIPRFTEVSTGNITQGLTVTVAGKLVEPDGHPVPGATVRATLDDEEQSMATDDVGRFSFDFASALPAAPIVQSLEFEGDGSRTPVTHHSERHVLSSTTLSLPSGESARGADLDISVSLRDATGSMVPGAPIWVTWGEEDPVLVITNSTGHGHFHRQGVDDDAIGPVGVKAQYHGSRDGGYKAVSQSTVWKIIAQSEILLPEGVYVAGEPISLAVLRDAGTLEPIRGKTVTFGKTNGTEPLSHGAVTDHEGRFKVLDASEPTDSPQTIPLAAEFAGDTEHAPAEASSNVTIQTPVLVDVRLPQDIVTGRPTLIRLGVVGLDGSAVDEGVIHATLGSVGVGSGPVVDGDAHLELLVPDDTPPGAAQIRFRFDDAQWYAPETIDVTTNISQSVSLRAEVEPAQAGGTTIIRVNATTSDGHPLPFEPIHLQVEGLAGGMRADTDEHGIATFHIQQSAAQTAFAARYTGGESLNSAHTLGAVAPMPKPTVIERGATVLPYVAAASAAVLTLVLPYVYYLRKSPLEPVFRRARRILEGRGPYDQRVLRAYLHLEEAAIGSRLLKDPATTARALEEAVAPRIPPGARTGLARFMDIFETVRYGDTDLEEDRYRVATMAFGAVIKAMRADALGFRRTSKARRTAS